MTRAYCTRCGAERDTTAGHCPAGHRVALDTPGYIGRHRARVSVPRMQVLEVLGFSDPATTTRSVVATRPANQPRVRSRIPSTPRRSSRPVGRHRYGSPTAVRRTTEINSFSLDTVDTKPTENTGVLVERLWEASNDTMADVETWHGLTRNVEADPGRRMWPWVVAALSLAAAAVTLWVLPGAFQERERVTAEEIGIAIDQSAADLSQAASVAGTILDPAADTATLSGMAVNLTRIDSAARSLLDQAVAAEEAGLNEASAIAQAGELALSLERRLSTVLTYRLLIESSLSLPELPAVASADELGDIARQLSETITSIRTDVESLPRDELLSSVRADALVVVGLLQDDQAAYLAALRDGDLDLAAVAAAGMHGRLDEIHAEFDSVLTSLSPWVSDTIAAIESNLDT